MKKILLLIIITVSVSLVFSQGKPCCKNKAGKAKVSCKLNTANISTEKDGALLDGQIETLDGSVKKCSSSNSASFDSANCNGCKKTSWWKFWAKSERFN